MKKSALLVLITLLTSGLGAQTIISHHFSLQDEAKYPEDFPHFDYVNPDAPQGGTMRLARMGTYDNFHRFALRGSRPVGIEVLHDQLMQDHDGEVDSLYPMIAEKIEYAEDYSFVIFHLNPNARFHDGVPIRASDVVFTINTFLEDGVPQLKIRYQGLTNIEALDDLRVRFDISDSSRDIVYGLATFPIIPEHFWKDRNFSEPLDEPPIGSGAYVVDDYSMGEWITYRRLEDYWARDLPANVGFHNLDYVRYDYYKDENVMLEAFKSGAYDFRLENTAKNWATQYNGPLFDSGYLKTEELPDGRPMSAQAFDINITREYFSDPRVRQALSYALDFEWLNETLFYGQYTRVRSFFQNTEYEATELPSSEELAILEPIKDMVPEEVFSEVYQPPVSDGSGSIRSGLREALSLFQEAGWELEDGVMRNTETGEPFEFELMIWSSSTERIALPLQENLENMGITMTISLVDTTQATNRLRDRDFDMMSFGYPTFYFPNQGLLQYFHSDFVDSTYNSSGIQDPAVDYLIDGILENQKDHEALIYWGRALDRVLQWNHLMIPQWGINTYRIAYVDKFGRPDTQPQYGNGVRTWWLDEEQSDQYFYSQWKSAFDSALRRANSSSADSQQEESSQE